MFLFNVILNNYFLLFYALLFLVKNTPILANIPTKNIAEKPNILALSIVLGDALTVAGVLGVEGDVGVLGVEGDVGVLGDEGVDGVVGTDGVTGAVGTVYTCTKSPFASR